MLNDAFDAAKRVLEVLESLPGIKYARSKKYGYITCSPSNLGTGMIGRQPFHEPRRRPPPPGYYLPPPPLSLSASVRLPLRNLTAAFAEANGCESPSAWRRLM